MGIAERIYSTSESEPGPSECLEVVVEQNTSRVSASTTTVVCLVVANLIGGVAHASLPMASRNSIFWGGSTESLTIENELAQSAFTGISLTEMANRLFPETKELTHDESKLVMKTVLGFFD